MGSGTSEFQVGLRNESNKVKSLVSLNGSALVYSNHGTINSHTSNMGTPYASVQNRNPAWRVGDGIGVAFDMDNDTFKFYLNGVLLTTQRFVGITGNDW